MQRDSIRHEVHIQLPLKQLKIRPTPFQKPLHSNVLTYRHGLINPILLYFFNQELIPYHHSSGCCCCSSSCWDDLFEKKPKAPSFQIGSGGNLAGFFLK